MADIWVVAEQWRGQLSEISFEVLALGRELADAMGAPLRAVLLGSGVRDLAGRLGVADSVVCIDDPSLAGPLGAAAVEALHQLAVAEKPQAILTPLTNVTMGLSTMLAGRLAVAAVNFCTNLQVVDGKPRAQCLLYGGKIECLVEATAEPAIFGIWPGVRPADKGRSDRAVPVVEFKATLAAEQAIRFERYIEPEAGDVDITKQDILVAVGRGIQSKDNLELAEELAEQLGAALCASRPVVDQGWLPLSRQVGKSGCIVKPKLYLAFGVSGAPEHVEGMRDSSLIVAVNTDAGAPIFNVAHYGVVADALELLRALTEAVRQRKAQVTHA